MELTFVDSYKSIVRLSNTELPDFSVLVGKNGSGKTHLLNAIEKGFIKADIAQTHEIIYFNSNTFAIPNQNEITARSLEDDLDTCWNAVTSYQHQLKSGKIKSIESLKQQIDKDFLDKPTLKVLLYNGLFHGGLIPSLTKSSFTYHASHYPEDYQLLNTLSHICFRYKRQMILNSLEKADGGQGWPEEQIKMMEQNSPWNFLNRMFSSFGLKHKINAPNFKTGDFIQDGRIPYKAQPNLGQLEIEFDSLSSGERILCALALTMYHETLEVKFPKIVLLDEIDSALHPSIISNLLSVIKNVFLKNGCKVILATHSPTTVALVEEAAIYEVKPGYLKDKIIKISQSEAINILSEGMMSIEKGLQIFDQLTTKSLSILTEGHNVKHINKAIEMLKPELLDKVHIITGAEAHTGAPQLKSLFEFFKVVNHKSKILFVLDTDQRNTVRKDSNNTFMYTLPFNEENKIAKDGIENIYPEYLIDKMFQIQHVITKHEKEISNIKFDGDRKNEFTDKILALDSKKDFENYLPLISKIESILEFSGANVTNSN